MMKVKLKNNFLLIDKRQRWDILHNFEQEQKERLLKKISPFESLKIFLSLYELARELGDRTYYKKLDRRKIKSLSKVHFMFMKVRQ